MHKGKALRFTKKNFLAMDIEEIFKMVEKQVPLPLIYKEVKLEVGYRIDLMVERQVIVEIKSVESLADIHMSQIITYLKLSGCKLGLLANFNVLHLKNGIKRVIL
jgi:GxxExxY protein